MREIKITIADDGTMDVHENGKCCGGLGWDEMLGQVAAMTIPHTQAQGRGIFRMLTPEQWTEHNNKTAEIIKKQIEGTTL